jgi:collagenase-like PrtC family protease
MAPAGGPEAALAAFEYGADAIYLGLQKFSARADAANFSLAQLDSVVAYAHGLTPRRRVYVAINTLVAERELSDLIDTVGAVADIGADAVIVQDLGVALAVRRHFPSLRLHSSTQLAVHNRAGVEPLRKLGFARVTLARELTLEELADVASVEGIETEAFVHGALCYAYSGLCLFSSHLVGRSGNRGQCAYPCRDDWTVEGAPAALADGRPTPRNPTRGFAFSMKDLAAADLLPELKRTGVTSLKIEGRKKSPLYVAAAVGYYRKLLDGGLSAREREAREADIKAIFNRPWTSLYLRSHRDKDVADPDAVGHRGVPIGAVEAVARSGKDVWVRFTTSRALERYDGLQIEIPGLGRPFGFGIDAMRLSTRGGKPRPVVRAEAGEVVEVALPDGYPTIPVGAPVFCSSSQEVKKRYRTEPVNLAAFRTRLPLHVRGELGRERLVVEAVVERAVGASGLLAGSPALRSAGLRAGVLSSNSLGSARGVSDEPHPLDPARESHEEAASPRSGRGDFDACAGGHQEAQPSADTSEGSDSCSRGALEETPRLSSARASHEVAPSPRSGRGGLGVGRTAAESLPAQIPARPPTHLQSLDGPFEPAKDASRTAQAFRGAMEKLGDSRFELASCELSNPEGLFVPVSKLNELRRQIVAALEPRVAEQSRAIVEAAREDLLADGPEPGPSAEPLSWSVKTDRLAHLSAFAPEDWSDVREVVIDIGREPLGELETGIAALAESVGRERIRVALPMITRRWEEASLRKQIARLRELGLRRWEASNLSAWSFLDIDPREPERAGLDLAADWPLYVLNRLSARHLGELGATSVVLSPEDGRENLAALLGRLGERATVVVFQDTPLFLSESCPNATLAGGCPGPAKCRFESMEMRSNSHGTEVIAINDRCRTITINRRPFCLGRRRRELEQAGARVFRADFVWRRYDPAEVRRIWRALRTGEELPAGHVGNFDRGLA